MLLSLILSFLLARKSRRIYAMGMIIIVGLLSFFSAFGLPKVTGILDPRFIKPTSLVPLSYPFYAYVYSYQTPPDPIEMSWISEIYSLDVLGIRIDSLNLSMMHLEDGGLYYSFFLLVNVIGAIMGYWISKAGFVDRHFKRRKFF